MGGARLPEDWRPSEDDVSYGLALGLTPRQIVEMSEDMRMWAGANANRQVARKSNWSMAFKGWMRREARKLKVQYRSQNNLYRSRAQDNPGYVHVMRESAVWQVYAERWKALKGKEPPVDRDGGWWFPKGEQRA